MGTFLIIKVSRSAFHFSGEIMRNVPIILRNSTVGGRSPETLSAGIKRTAGSHPKERVSGGLPRTLAHIYKVRFELFELSRLSVNFRTESTTLWFQRHRPAWAGPRSRECSQEAPALRRHACAPISECCASARDFRPAPFA